MSVKYGGMAAPESGGLPQKWTDMAFEPLDDMEGTDIDNEALIMYDEEYYEEKDEKMRRAMRVSEAVREKSGGATGKPWPVIPAIARALLGEGKVLDKDSSTVRSISRRMMRRQEEKMERTRFARVLSVKCNSKPGTQVYTSRGRYAGLKDGWSWSWGEERRTIVGRPMTLREVRRLPACDLKAGVWGSPGPWMMLPGQNEEDWWLVWTPIIGGSGGGGGVAEATAPACLPGSAGGPGDGPDDVGQQEDQAGQDPGQEAQGTGLLPHEVR